MSDGNRKANGALLAAACCVAALHILYFFPRTVDDMYIYLRYAENIASGNGFVYNIGEPVEGYSGPLWQVVLALAHFVGLGGVSITKVLGILSLGLLCWGTFRLAVERFELSWGFAWLSVFALILNSYVVTWSILGLETTSYLAFMIWTAVWMRRRAVHNDQKSFVGLSLCAGALLLSRPEAPLFAGAIGIAEVLSVSGKENIRRRLQALIPPSLVATVPFALMLVARRIYFGLWLPHTHYAKPGNGLDLNRLAPLVRHGASVIEIIFFVLFCLSALWLIKKKRNPLPAAILIAVMFFVSMVEKDWMPDIRHFLPWQCFIAMTLLSAASSLDQRRWVVFSYIGVAIFAIDIASIDVRFVPSDAKSHNDKNGRRTKSLDKWKDTWRALTNQAPEHVMTMGNYSHGMITQVYDILETDQRNLSDTWYVGRDIGRVGWLTPVKVYDTAALFTPEIIEMGGPALINAQLTQKAMSRSVVVAELLGDWYHGGFTPSVRKDYKPGRATGRFVLRASKAPSHQEVVRRYQEAISKLPTSYNVMTLYGEGVGAAIKRRLSILQEQHELESELISDTAPTVSGPKASFDTQVNLLGCEVPTEVARGEVSKVDCYYRVVQPVSHDFTIFVHTIEKLISADHRLPSSKVSFLNAPMGKVLHDRFQFYVTEEYPNDVIAMRIGLYDGNYRATPVTSDEQSKVDAENRVVLPDIRVHD